MKNYITIDADKLAKIITRDTGVSHWWLGLVLNQATVKEEEPEEHEHWKWDCKLCNPKYHEEPKQEPKDEDCYIETTEDGYQWCLKDHEHSKPKQEEPKECLHECACCLKNECEEHQAIYGS